MAHPMTSEQTRAFLSEGTRTGMVATVRADGRPHAAPVWFVVDGTDDSWDLVFMTGADSVKGKSLARDPRAVLALDLAEPPYGFVTVEGSVELSTDLDAMLPLSIAIARRYVGAAEAEAFGRRNAVDGELLVRLRPSKVIAIADLMGE